MSNPTPHSSDAFESVWSLTSGDQAVVDANFSMDNLSVVNQATSVLGLLRSLPSFESNRADRQALIDLTLARVRFERANEGETAQEHRPDNAAFVLTPLDEEATEAIFAASCDLDRVPASLQPRACRILAILSQLSAEPDADIARVDDRLRPLFEAMRIEQQVETDRLVLEDAAGQVRNHRWRLPDLASAAAVLLVGTLSLLPMFSGMQHMAGRITGQANMMTAGAAFASYADSYRDAYPLASDSEPGRPWWHTGNVPESNSANLYTLSRTGYVPLAALTTPSHLQSTQHAFDNGAMDWSSPDQLRYSFQVLFTDAKPSWSGSNRLVVLTDRSPVIELARHRRPIDPLANSFSHNGAGQNVLFNDGSVRWFTSPVLDNGDNIWLPEDLERLLAEVKAQLTGQRSIHIRGNETPDREDSFVGP